jgi:alpha-beta hydrolase superfamily lysophospholipase
MRATIHAGLGYFEGVGRLRLAYRSWEVGEPRAATILVHGLFEHSGRYREFGEFMAGAGFSTFAFDLRGHGQSEGRRGHVRRFHVLLQDLDRFRREVQGLLPLGTPLFLVGHALGGLIVVRYLEEYSFPATGAVVTSPCFGTAVPVPRWRVLLANVLDRVLPAFPLRFAVDPALLSHDEDRVAGYRSDPHIHGTFTPRLFTEMSAAIHTALHRGEHIGVPVHFLLAGRDRMVDPGRSFAFARALPAHLVTIRVLEDLYHDLLQERERSAVMAEIRDWILDQLG